MSKPVRAGLGIALLCLAAYLANGRTLPFEKSGDTAPSRLLPFALLAFGTPTLDPFAEDFAAHGGYRWFVQERRGHLVSFYPIGPALTAFPVYVPAWAWLAATGRGGHSHLFAASPALEKLAASVIAALVVLFVYLTLRRRVPARSAFWAAIGLGLGTSLWATASQMLWQHGPVALAIAAAAFFLTRPERPVHSTALAGLALSLAFSSRPTAALFAIAALAGLLLERRPWRQRLEHAGWLAAAAMPVVLLTIAFNHYWYGTPLGGYSLATGELTWIGIPGRAAGLLLSPNRGLLFFTPIALLGVAGLVRSFRRLRDEPHLPMLALAAAAHFLFLATYRQWMGGWSFGPRYLVDVLPILGLAAGLELPRLPRRALPVVAAALVWSILVQWNGAFCYPASQWDARMGDRAHLAAWDWRHLQLREDFAQWRSWPFWATPY